MTTPFTFTNPYVGPATFTVNDRDRYFGREREAASLLGRMISERLLLFYAQSGAGKSSLINARLIPSLKEEEGFSVLPVGRVAGTLPPGLDEVENIFLFNLMSSLDQIGGNPSRFAHLSLVDFVEHLITEDGITWRYDPGAGAKAEAGPTEATQGQESSSRFALIIDQFEEIITGHPDHWDERDEFFRQLDGVLQANPNLWVVLSLREDYVATLDPYASLVFNRLRARFYMERMNVAAALEAIRQPAALAERPFAEGVAERLVDNLRQVRIAGQSITAPGQYVEPVQLQLVCYQLWESVAGQPVGPIRKENLQEAGDVDQALSRFYENTVRAVLKEPSVVVSERRLRVWFNNELITESGTRGTIYQGTEQTAGMSNQIVRMLQDRFLLRTELRAGGSWVELVHDRFVDPIRSANLSWRLNYENPLERATRTWLGAGRDTAQLASAKQLDELQAHVRRSYSDITEDEQDFLKASEQKARDTVSRRRGLLFSAIVGSMVILLFVIGYLIVASGLRGTWQVVEPILYAGSVRVPAMSLGGSEAVYAITNSGPNRSDTVTLLKYTPENDNWSILTRNLTTNVVNTMLVVNVDGSDYIYISKKSTGLIRSNDQGRSWSSINVGLTSFDIQVLTADPTNTRILYAGSADRRGVFQSLDGGDTWQNISDDQGFVGLTVLTMAYSTYKTHRLLVGTDDGRIIAYDQDIDVWWGVSTRPGAGRIETMAVEPTRTQTLYAGTSNGKILRSDDGGENWQPINYSSMQDGRAIPDGYAVASMVIVPFDPEQIYVNTWGIGGMVLWKSDDGGKTWQHTKDDTFTRQPLQWLLISPLHPEVLHVVGDAGMFTTKDGGSTWYFHEMGSPQVSVEGIALSAIDSGSIYIRSGGAIFSNDLSDMEHWQRGSGLPAQIIRDIVVHPQIAGKAYAAVYLQNEWSVFWTDDRGITWQRTGLPPIPEPFLGDTISVEIGKNASGEILYAGTNGCGVFTSLDNGLTWQTFGRRDCNSQSITGPQSVIDIQTVPQHGNTLYVAADNSRIYISSDQGKTWSKSEVPTKAQITKIALDPFQSGVIYLIAGVEGFWRSEDNGQHWTSMSSGLENSRLIDLAVVPDRAQTLFVVALTGEVWKTINGGRTWTSIRYNLLPMQIGPLGFDTRTRELWIGSRQGGLFKYQPGFLESYQIRPMTK